MHSTVEGGLLKIWPGEKNQSQHLWVTFLGINLSSCLWEDIINQIKGMNIFKCPGAELISICDALGMMAALGQCHRPPGLLGQSLLCRHTTSCTWSHMGQPRSQLPSTGTCRSGDHGDVGFFVFCLFIIPPHMDVNCFGPGGITCHLLSKPRSRRAELGWHGLFLGLASEPAWQLPPTRLGTADEKCPLSEVKIKRKRCCSCRLHFSLLLAMWQTHRVLYLYLECSNFSR